MKTRTMIIAFCIFSVLFSLGMTIWNKATGDSSNANFVASGPGFKVYGVYSGGGVVYIVKSTDGYPVAAR
jgi:branched-subunit amino acid permease